MIPEIKTVLGTALECEKLINETFPTEEEVRDIQNKLDSQWLHMNERITVTGRVSYRDPESGQMVDTIVDEDEYISGGFIFYPIPIELDEEIAATQYQARYYLLKPIDKEGTVLQLFSAQFNDVVIDYPTSSLALVTARLDYFSKDTLDELDTLLMNGRDEMEATLSLADFVVTVDSSQESDTQKLLDLQTYINHFLEYDDEFMYLVRYSGLRFYRYDERGVFPAYSKEVTRGAGHVHGVVLLETSENKDGQCEYLPCLFINYYDPSKDTLHKSNVEVYIPIKNLHQFDSIRQIVDSLEH